MAHMITEIGLRERLSGLEWDWLSDRLLTRVGVCGAVYRQEGKPRLVVTYESAAVDTVELRDLLYLSGVRPEASASAGDC